MNDETSKLIAKVERFARQEQLFAAVEPGRALHLCAAVSGGADSMALLRVLLELRETFGYPLTACHVNHGLRGETADRDETFVRAECARLGVPLTVFRPADVGMAVPPHAGEDWARRLRYACFAQLLAGGIDCIATAHTATDQAETLLFRLARGTGLHGAGGIRPRRPGYCRPLLGLTRAETEALCAAFEQGWVTDETNDSDAYARNRLRHGAVPALRSVNAAAEENLARFCEKAARADAYFARQAEQLLSIAHLDAAQTARKAPKAKAAWRLEPLQGADPIILEAALHSLVAPVRDAEEKYIRLLAELVEQGSGAVQLTDTVRFCAGSGMLWQEEGRPEAAAAPAFSLPFAPADGAEFALPGGQTLKTRLFVSGFREKTQGVHKKDLKNRADYARITLLYSALTLRTRQPGDRFRPAGRGLSKPLRKWMNEAGIPAGIREGLPLLAAGSEILWRALPRGWPRTRRPNRSCSWNWKMEEQPMSMNDDIKNILVSEEALKAKVAELGAQISRDYEGRNLVLVSILKGSVVFMADLMRAVTIPCNIDFMVVSSYGGSNTTTSGLVKIIKDLDGDLSGKDVLIVEDILDTGVTLSKLVPMLKMRNPNSVKICTILDKPSRRKADIQPDYEGFQVPDEFVVGYGLDYDEKYRNLPYVGVLKPEIYA